MSVRSILSCLAFLALAAASSAQALKFDISAPATGLYGCTPSATCRDSTGNAYITGTCESRPLTEKITAAGAVAWRNYYLKPKLTQDAYPGAIFHDSASGNTIVIGSLTDTFVTSQSGIYVECLTSGGSVLWQIEDYAHSIGFAVLDSAGDLLTAAPRTTTSIAFDLIKYNGINGAVIYSRPQEIGTDGTRCYAITIDSAGRLYAVIDAALTGVYVSRFNEATGSLVWRVSEGPYTGYPKLYPTGIAILPSGDLIITGAAANSSITLPLYLSLDRLSATNGAFTSRKTILLGDSNWHVSNAYAWQAEPSVDTYGNVYILTQLLYSDYLHDSWVATKVSDTFGEDWSCNLTGPLAAPSIAAAKDGGAYVAIAPKMPGHRQEVWRISSSGAITYQVPSKQFGEPDGFSVFRDDPALVGGVVVGNTNAGYGFGFQTFNGQTGSILVNAKDDPTGEVSTNLMSPVTDAQGNVYAIDALVGPSASRVNKYSQTGALIWSVNVKNGTAAWTGTPSVLRMSPNGQLIVAARVPLATFPSRTLGYAALNPATGATEWVKEWNNAGAVYFDPEYLAVNHDGTFIIAAENDSGNQFEGKFSVTGALLWSKQVGTALHYPNFCSNLAGDFCLYYSTTQSNIAGYGLELVNATGTLASKFVAFGNSGDTGPQAAMDAAGNLYVTYSTPNGRALDRVSSAGAKLETVLLSNLSYSVGVIAFDVTNDLLDVAIGEKPSYLGPATMKVFKVTTAGKVIWTSKYEAGNGDSPTMVAQDTKGDVIVLGATPIAAGAYKATSFIHKVAAATGAMLYHFTYAGKFNCPDVTLAGLAIEPDGTPVITGQSRLTGTESTHVGIGFRLGA